MVQLLKLIARKGKKNLSGLLTRAEKDRMFVSVNNPTTKRVETMTKREVSKSDFWAAIMASKLNIHSRATGDRFPYTSLFEINGDAAKLYGSIEPVETGEYCYYLTSAVPN